MRTKTLTIARELAALLVPSWHEINAAITRSGVPVCRVAEDSLKAKLRDTEEQLAELRTERAELQKVADDAREAYAKSNEGGDNGPTYRRAIAARDKLHECDGAIDAQRSQQEEILRLIGGGRGNRSRGAKTGRDSAGDGWATVANELRLGEGRNRVNLPLGDLIGSQAMAALSVSPSSGLTAPAIPAPFMQMARDERHVWMVFPSGESLDPEVAAITDYRQTGSRTVTGSVERDPVATTPEKATLGLQIELVTPPLRQFAVIADEIPSKLFDFIPALQAFLQSEMAYQVHLALDAHCLAQIAAAAPPVGLSGATLIEQCRNGVAAMRKLGAKPTILCLDPDDAAALDVQKDGSESNQHYIFATRDTGSSSPLFGNAIVEAAGLSAPTLLDPAILGAMYTGMATVLADPFTSLDTNEVRLRIEMEGLLHVRDIQGAYVIDAGE